MRIYALYDLLASLKLDALIVTHDDEYLSYELTEDSERIAYLTGFTGSAGMVLLARNFAESTQSTSGSSKGESEEQIEALLPTAIFVDGRYEVQVKEQIDPEVIQPFNLTQVKPQDWLKQVLPKKAKVGIDLNCISYHQYLTIKNELAKADIELIATKSNLVDEIWENKPQQPHSLVEIYPDEFNGKPSPQKRHDLAEDLRQRGLDATVICDPESICWLLNIRGRDRPCLPIVNCRMVAYSNEALEWYISADHISEENLSDLEAHFGHVDIFTEQRFDDALERLCTSSSHVYADPESVNAHALQKLYAGGAKVVEGIGLCQLSKACKNSHEIAGEYHAHVKDGVAMCRFLAWLDDLVKPETQQDPEVFQHRVSDTDEAVLANRAEAFRKVEGNYIEPSFDTISALGPNSAMPHYNYATLAEPRKLGSDVLYLIDSGAHYLDGTTDITRTVQVHYAGVTEEIKQMYTLVLKAHIALATAIFPVGTSGMQLDALARRPLWDYGLDYDHGTGHGVGHLLSVHEGPQAISSHRSTIPLQEGMVISDEPGYYSEGNFGIRLENLLVVQKCAQPGLNHMLCFLPLTMVPFDLKLIDLSLLSDTERAWLNSYHHNVFEIIEAASTTLTDIEMSWLKRATAEI